MTKILKPTITIILNLITLARRARPEIRDFRHTNTHLKVGIGIILSWLSVIFINQPAKAQIVDSVHYNWTVYEYENENNEEKECYMVSFAKDSNTSHTAKRNPHIIITRFAKSRIEEISIYAGYEYKINSNAFILIGQDQYKLFTEGEVAWFRTAQEDKDIIQKMLQTDTIRFRSDSAIGSYAIDEYQMRGITRAYARLKELCQ